MGETAMRTLVVGIDSACLPVLEPLFDAGVVPTLRELFDEGSNGPLESQIPPWTPSAWPSIYTGMNPGKHGVYDFLSFEGYDWTIVDAADVRERTLWELLSHHGHSSVVVNAPVTHPPRPFDGALVPGYMAPERPTCHPEGLLADIEDAIGEYRIYPRSGGADAEPYREVVEMRGQAFQYLVDRFEPDFGFLQFQVTDTVFHEHAGDRDIARAVYQAVDTTLAAVLDSCEPRNVLIVSDHGMGPYTGHEFRINEQLRRAGFVETTRGGEGMPTWATVRDTRLKAAKAPGRTGGGTIELLGATAARMGMTAQRVEEVLDRLGVRETVARHVPTEAIRAASEQVDFAASRAYARSRTECGIRINLAGREPDGTVPPEEYESIRAELIDQLTRVRTPDGDPVFDEVAPSEEYYHGPAADRAVDIVTVPASWNHFLSTKLARSEFGAPSEPWNHKQQGVIALSGPDLQGADTSSAHIFDVAPTVLDCFGLPVDERMDGLSLLAQGEADEQPYPSFEPATIGPADKGDVAERLTDLGYLEHP